MLAFFECKTSIQGLKERWMVRIAAALLVLVPLLHYEGVVRASSSGVAYISILSSDDFILAARVVSKALQIFNKSIPYIVLATEDVNNRTIQALIDYGIRVEQTKKLDTPYASTHHGAKYHYTKMRLWSLVEYDNLVYLDLDSLPVADISELFDCFPFCAVFRHSDLFNFGVFVLQPNMTVYETMLNATTQLYSYDGGDQGFMNSFFERLKYAPMFDPSRPARQSVDGGFRLSAAYNYDVGMHYLTGTFLVRPKVVHYTLGPVKPWMWWTYPIFDLHWRWLRVRRQLERDAGEPIVHIGVFLNQIYLSIFLLVGYHLLSFYIRDKMRSCRRPTWEAAVFSVPSLVISTGAAYLLVPTATHPIFAWILFYVDLVLIWIWIGMLYCIHRIGRNITPSWMFRFVVTAGTLMVGQWLLLCFTPVFLLRSLLFLITSPILIAILCQQYTLLVLNNSTNQYHRIVTH